VIRGEYELVCYLLRRKIAAQTAFAGSTESAAHGAAYLGAQAQCPFLWQYVHQYAFYLMPVTQPEAEFYGIVIL
jgi:hypothetical protein